MMDLMSKRKKRKTRKSLNELRNRLYGKLNDGDHNICTNSARKVNNKQKYITNSSCIAANRLTLGLFHKAVRSETVTRSALSDLKQTVSNVNIVINKDNEFLYNNCCKSHNLCTTTNKNSCPHSNNTIIARKYKTEEMGNRVTSSKGNWILHKGNLSNNPTLCSPFSLQMTMTPIFETSAEETLSLTASSLESSQFSDVHKLYEEFIYSMPKYLMEKTPALVGNDIMKQTKNFLHKLYIDGYHYETENNILKCIQKKIHKETIEMPNISDFSLRKVTHEGPMNYISLKYARQESEPFESVASSISSQNSNLTTLNMSHSSQSFFHGTPDYIYFPHKLNQ